MATFGWCLSGHHNECIREYEIVFFDTARKGQPMVKTGETMHCECAKRGCKCWVRKTDRTKAKKRTPKP